MIIFLLLDNDKPSVTTPDLTPVENTSTTTTLTCNPTTTDSITGYEWYKGTNKIANAAASTYDLSDNGRQNSGSYQCKVVSSNVGTSVLSDATTLTFLCKSKSLLPYLSVSPMFLIQGSTGLHRKLWSGFLQVKSR